MTDAKIPWRAWGEDAFNEARSLDRPILLRLSAVWCHWCHVMDHTSDEDPRAIELLRERYVPIRVDIDRMPDVRERYNFGGYPTSAFLTPEGDILTGGTYIPPDQFVELLSAVADAYATRKDEILRQVREHRGHRHRHASAPPVSAPEKAIEDLVEDTAASLLALFDPEAGGFGKAPKFPQGAATELSILLGQATGRRDYETVARGTLDAMRASALWDPEELAFFRYSVKPDWSEPHYEKMLETNASLLGAYARAAAAWGRREDVETGALLKRYLDASLRDPATGLFFGSQDADEAYYALPLAERRRRTAPYVDRTHYTDWVSQMVGSFCKMYLATSDAAWLKDAVATLQQLVAAALPRDGGFLHYVREGKAHRSGLFTDQAYGARALLDVYELTGEEGWFEAAARVVDAARETFFDAATGVFNDRDPKEEGLGLLREPQSSVVENGVMAQVVGRLLRIEPRAVWRQLWDDLLRGHAGAGERYNLFAAEWALAALERRGPRVDVHATVSASEFDGVVAEARRIGHPGVRVYREPVGSKRAAARLGGGPPAGTVFFCDDSSCSRLYKAGDPFAEDARRRLG